MKKKLILGLMTAGSAVATIAEDVTPTMDTTQAENLLTAAKNGLTGLLSSAAPIITAIVLAGLAIWAALAILRIVKRAFSKAQ